MLAERQVPGTPTVTPACWPGPWRPAAGRRCLGNREHLHYGLGPARHLAARTSRSRRSTTRPAWGKRRAGKCDAIDAVRAARELLARPAPAQTRADGDREALRLLMIDRDNAVQSCKTARTALAAIGHHARPAREQLARLSRQRRPSACAALTCPERADRQTRVLHQTLIRLGQRIAALAETAAELETQITGHRRGDGPGPGRRRTRPRRAQRRPDPAVLVHAGRIRSEAAFAMLSGTAPVPSPPAAPSATLNRLGDRQLNRALHIIAITRMRCHPPTMTYVQRRRAEGKTDKEIRRCLKRYLARHLYRTLNNQLTHAPIDLTNIGASLTSVQSGVSRTLPDGRTPRSAPSAQVETANCKQGSGVRVP